MDAILHNLGIDLSSLILQGIGFILMYLILKKFVFGHIGAALETRKKISRIAWTNWKRTRKSWTVFKKK